MLRDDSQIRACRSALGDGHHLRGASVVHRFCSARCRRGPGVQDLVLLGVMNVENRTPRHFLSAQHAIRGCFKEVGVAEDGGRFEHNFDRQISADAGLVGHFFQRQTGEVIVHLAALPKAWRELAIEDLKCRVLHSSMIEPGRNCAASLCRGLVALAPSAPG